MWNRVDETEAPEGVVVNTLSHNGLEQPLKRSGNLWFLQDGSMYVYYTPEFWKDI